MCPHDQDQLWYEIYEFFNSFIQDFSTSVLNNSIKIILSVKIVELLCNMNGVEFIVIDCLKQKKWEIALQHLNQLLERADQMEPEKRLTYLLWRSQCLFALSRFEACISDCREIMNLVPTEAPRNNFWFKARWRLAHALIKLKAFGEAKRIAHQLIDLCTDFTKQECIKLLERIRFASQLVNHDDDYLSNYLLDLDTFSNNRRRKEKPNNSDDKSYPCCFCNVTYDTVEELRDHCATQSHQKIIMSDEGRDWKKRPPPRGLTAETYNLCSSYGSDAVGYCSNGAQCVDAHGIEELNEWKERFEYRMMKVQRSDETLWYGKSYTGLILNKLAESSNPETIMRESIEGVEEEIQGELTTIFDSKISDKQWLFTFRTTKVLKVVALLYDSHRSHFSLGRITTSKGKKMLLDDQPVNTQEWTSRLDLEDENQKLVHKVEVNFSTKLYGTFRQTVLFDFGKEPYLMKSICVDVVPVNDAEKIKEVQQELVLSSTERWEESNSVIVPFTSTVIDYSFTTREQELLSKYYVPTGHKFTITQSMLNDDCVTKNNYRARMHELLYIEEMACYDQVAKYCVRANMQVVSSYILSPNMSGASTAKFSTGGELFAMITLTEEISEDSAGGRLVLNNCVSVLLADGKKVRRGDNSHKLKVYEAVIEDKGKNVVYLRLSAQTVADMKFKQETSVTLEMQFQLNRIPFCEWHQAVDCVSDYRIIFPDVLNIPEIPKISEREWTEDDSKLNDKQREAISAITVPQEIALPPVLIIGPFGTGKTYTLARAVKHILQEKDTKILICTHSNSAADLYIKEYLHPYVQSGLKEATPLRIYYHKRWVSTVNSTVLEYCLIDVVSNTRIFRVPQLEDILKHRIIVVTLNIASHLSSIGLPKGYFSHILLDEAAQAIECEAIMPLSLANERTRIVLAGDHMQLSPEIFSSFAKQKKFHISLLQRLYESYPTDFPCKIVLCENYRAHKAIVQFTSNLFYDNKLLSVGGQPRHKKFYPLTFFTALGEDVQDKNSTGFYNCAEVYELVERVIELKNNWPECWGKFNEHSIGIMTPYPDQVYRIRIELKKRKMMGISVERVLNVQGKQFRAIFLSTVRTARTCVTDEKDSEDISVFDYGFLSNKKLLNTAVTRAQSLVAVIGDPVSLCTIGRCRKIWENFIETCSKNNSLFGLSWQDVKSLLLAVELKKKYKLNPLAPEFVPRYLQMEPYLQIAGPSQMMPQTAETAWNGGISAASNAGLPMNFLTATNNLTANRVYTYDNIRFQLPQKATVMPAAAPVMQPATEFAGLSSAANWPPLAPPPTVTPVTPLSSPIGAAAAAVSLKTPPTTSTTLRTPPGFSPVPVPSSPIFYPPTTASQSFAPVSTPFSGLYPPISRYSTPPPAPFPPTAASPPYVSTTVRTPDSTVHLTLIPLSQYVRSHPPPAAANVAGTKTFSPPVVNLGNSVCSPAVNLPNGYKTNTINNVFVQNFQNEVNYTQDYSSTYLMAQNAASTSPNVAHSAPTVQETNLKNVLPAQVPLSEMLKNTNLQKQWLSHLMDSKQINEAQMFLNLLRSHLSKEAPKETVSTSQKMAAKFVTNDSPVAGRGLPPISQMNLNGSTGADSKEPESADDAMLIPPDILLPSSLLPDLMPSGSMRRGPLYDRDSRKQLTQVQVNGLSAQNGPTIADHHAKMGYHKPSNLSAAATAAYGSNSHNNMVYAEPDVGSGYENPYARMNGDHLQFQQEQYFYDTQNKLSSSQGIRSFVSSNGGNSGAAVAGDYSVAKKLVPKGPGPWNLATNSPFVNGNSAEDVNGSKTYAAALRQPQQKFGGIREYDCQSTFEF